MGVINKRLKLVAAISATLTLLINGQSAFADFSGDFAPDKWTYSETAPGPSASLNSTTMVLISADNGCCTANTGLYSITIPNGVSTISFTFSYITNDGAGSSYDMSTYTYDGNSTDMFETDVGPGVTVTGTKTVSVSGGKVFSINQISDDSSSGAATTTITGFNAVYLHTAADTHTNADVLLENSKPTLTAGSKTLVCTPGGFDMMRGGFFKQVGKPTSIVYALIIAGKRVSSLSSDNWTGLSRVIYDSSDSSVAGKATLASATWNIDSFAAGSARCETLAYQEGSVTTSNSNTL